jgi:hypothetical protein
MGAVEIHGARGMETNRKGNSTVRMKLEGEKADGDKER